MNNKPNVVLIFADDLGYGDVSIFNPDSKIKTKNIDRLAKRGMRFTDSHATSALCTPSRYGLLTGRYNWRSRLKSFVIPGDSETLIEQDRKTIAQLLKDEGYNTAAVGKWHLGLDWTLLGYKDFDRYQIDPDCLPEEAEPRQGREGNFDIKDLWPGIEGLDIDYDKPITFGPNQYGFDYFFGTSASLDQPPFVYIENDRVLEKPTVITGLPQLDRNTGSMQRTWQIGPASPEYSHVKVPDDMQAKVLELIDDYSKLDDPFFIYYPNHLVHGPLLPNAEHKGKSEIGLYGDFVLQLDTYVGEIIDKLEELDEFENTIFVFTSDNGVSGVAGIEELKAQGHDPSYHFRGKKSDIWEGGHREPTIISYPPMIEADSVSEQMISHSDLYRTLADILSVDIGDEVAEDSISNISLWKGDNAPIREDIVHSSGVGGFSIRRDFWKLTLVKNGGGMQMITELQEGENNDELFRATELYDLRDDISETNNIIDQHPEVVEELKKALEEYIRSGRSTEGQDQPFARSRYDGTWPQISWMENSEEIIESETDEGENNE